MHREQTLIQLISECLEEKRCLVGGDATSMHQHAAGLIDDNERIILKANSEWHLSVGHNVVSLFGLSVDVSWGSTGCTSVSLSSPSGLFF